MARNGLTTLTQDLAQRETDRQRWADDGGKSPDAQPDTPAAARPVALPVRAVYRRLAGWLPPALLASTAPPPAR